MRHRTPTLLQMEATECGAAALGIVLAHHGRWLTLEELRQRCGVSRDGSRAANIARAARALGLEVQAFRAEPEALGEVALPAILHWGMDHFVVLEGRRGRHWFINDPARGPRRVEEAEFGRQFTGVVLALQPGPEFRRGGAPPSVSRALAGRLDGAWPGFALLLGLSLLLLLPGLLLPAAAQLFIDQVLVARLQDWLLPLLGGMVALALLMAGLTRLQLSLLLRLETRLAVQGSGRFLERLLRLPLGFYAQRHPGDVATRVLLNNRLAILLAGELGRALLALVGALVYLAAMLAYAPDLAAVVAGLAALNLLALQLSARALADDNHRLLSETALGQGEARQGLQLLEAYRAKGAEALLLRRLVARQARVLGLRQGLALRRAVVEALPAALAVLAAGAVLVLGGQRVMAGQMSVGALVAFQGLMAGFAGPLAQLTQLGAQFQDARAYLAMLDDTLRHPLAEEFSPVAEAAPLAAPALAAAPVTGRLRGALELRRVSFGHARLGPPLLRDISFRLPPGARLGLAGGSGSGKSTLGGLIAGLHTPWSGEVLVDGRPLAAWPRARLRGDLALVDQNVVLFEGSVRDNLTLWDPTLSEERLQAACHDAAIHLPILQRGGYGSPVAEDGRDLSGGQRARLELARALAMEPRILVLDEATAALDAVTEAEVLANLRRRGCTLVMIAHRASALRDCDEVLVLEQGAVIERGAPAALLRQGGAFARLLAEAA
ncbi:cysteine peptidase family C39 domain-containing protein [Pseudoroseomonas cervicalis]|uniref:cysteine peptidase family C39 domain-containing protein n=1 Tax=Teichococcus cervicalis TaxID=204525 RepID=UPI002780F945|nr:cysteine peptidase family C39 domain-containing protein [Pseudoroseomonas cervicalis]MDQ1081612.1 NHLM bacteriocin system ABC transporter peptidase/ATP-binding protein [Pseudoroseomonas cervicalis]